MRAWLVVITLVACKSAAPLPVVVDAGEDLEIDAGTNADAIDDNDSRAWVSYSGDGKTMLRHKSVGGQCYAECRLGDGTRAWEGVSTCLAEKHERHFVSIDCERVVVLTPAPDRGKPWSATSVMRVYSRNQLDYSVPGSTVLPEKLMATSTSWLKGTFGIPGNEPHYSADGWSVEYETIDGKSGSVSLQPKPKDEKPAAEPKPKAPARRRHK